MTLLIAICLGWLASPRAAQAQQPPTIGLHLNGASAAPPAGAAAAPGSDDEPAMTLESLEGVPSLEVHSIDDHIRQVRAGGELHAGDRFGIPLQAVARIAYEDGAQVLLTPGTQATLSREEGVAAIRLDKGTARALIEPSPQRKLKFMIRTRAAVMGVRGTDFFADTDGDSSSVHTVEGTVELARDPATLRAGNGVGVGASQTTEALPGQPIAKARPFDARRYVADFHRKHPRMEGLYRRAFRESRSGRLKRRFRKVHQQRRARKRDPVRKAPPARRRHAVSRKPQNKHVRRPWRQKTVKKKRKRKDR